MRVPPAPMRTMGHAPITEAHTGLRALGWDLDLAADLGVSESRDLYRSEELLRAENDRLLARTWSIVGSTADLPERGSFLTVTIAGIPIVVVRVVTVDSEPSTTCAGTGASPWSRAPAL